MCSWKPLKKIFIVKVYLTPFVQKLGNTISLVASEVGAAIWGTGEGEIQGQLAFPIDQVFLGTLARSQAHLEFQPGN